MKNKLTIAITGHRDIIETSELKKEVDDFLESLLLKNRQKELILLSPLADGADRLVAKLFLEKQQHHPNLKLHVPMPFTKQRYMKDFNIKSKEEFLTLLSFSENTFKVPSEMNEDSYQTLGYSIANNCDILLALWDKTFNGKSGGTGDVVAYAEKQSCKIKIFFCNRKSTLKKT